METHRKPSPRATLRGPRRRDGPSVQRHRVPRDRDGIDGLLNAMDAGPDAATPRLRPSMRRWSSLAPWVGVAPLPDRLDQSELGDAPVPGNQWQAEDHGRGGDEAVPRVAERVAGDLPERRRDVQGDRLGLERGIRIAEQPEDLIQLIVGECPARADHVPEVNDRGDGDGNAVDRDRKSTRLNSSHANISYAVFC